MWHHWQIFLSPLVPSISRPPIWCVLNFSIFKYSNLNSKGFWWILGHFACGNGSSRSFHESCCIIKDKNMLIIGVIFFCNVHCSLHLLKDIFVSKVAFSKFPCLEEYMCSFFPIGGLEPSIISWHKVHNHQGHTFALWFWDCHFHDMTPVLFQWSFA